jgi:hypothetical protein
MKTLFAFLPLDYFLIIVAMPLVFWIASFSLGIVALRPRGPSLGLMGIYKEDSNCKDPSDCLLNISSGKYRTYWKLSTLMIGGLVIPGSLLVYFFPAKSPIFNAITFMFLVFILSIWIWSIILGGKKLFSDHDILIIIVTLIILPGIILVINPLLLIISPNSLFNYVINYILLLFLCIYIFIFIIIIKDRHSIMHKFKLRYFEFKQIKKR